MGCPEVTIQEKQAVNSNPLLDDFLLMGWFIWNHLHPLTRLWGIHNLFRCWWWAWGRGGSMTPVRVLLSTQHYSKRSISCIGLCAPACLLLLYFLCGLQCLTGLFVFSVFMTWSWLLSESRPESCSTYSSSKSAICTVIAKLLKYN